MTFADIKNDVYFLTGANSTSYPIANLTDNINRALENAVSMIIASDGRWQWDDTNNTDYPIGRTNLVSAQQDYTLATEHILISRIEVIDSNGTWHLLQPIDQADLYNRALTDYLSTNDTPRFYDKIATSLFLYPAPSYNATNGLKVWFQRAPSYFLTSDSTKVPGINTLYHRYLSLSASYDFAIKNTLPLKDELMEKMQVMEDAIRESYALRGKDEHITLKSRQTNNLYR